MTNKEVTPFVGVWIETFAVATVRKITDVTPFVGVWIETETIYIKSDTFESHPSWVCGLKLHTETFIA